MRKQFKHFITFALFSLPFIYYLTHYIVKFHYVGVLQILELIFVSYKQRKIIYFINSNVFFNDLLIYISYENASLKILQDYKINKEFAQSQNYLRKIINR